MATRHYRLRGRKTDESVMEVLGDLNLALESKPFRGPGQTDIIHIDLSTSEHALEWLDALQQAVARCREAHESRRRPS